MNHQVARGFYVLGVCRLERLELGMCGRGFSDAVAAAMVKGGELAALRALTLGGAYRVTDADLGRLLAAAPRLAELRLPQCSRLQDAAAIARLTPCLECERAALHACHQHTEAEEDACPFTCSQCCSQGSIS